MDELQPSRRQLLRSSGAAMAALAGCLGPSDSNDEQSDEQSDDGSPAERLQLVPDKATGVVRVDAASLLSDEHFRGTINDLASEARPDGQQVTVETALDAVQQRTDLDPRAVTELLGFGRAGEDPYAGGYVWSEWTDSELTSRFESGGASTREYGDSTLYERDGVAVVPFGDGQYALGTTPAVEDAVDLRQGDLSPVGGDVVSAYTAARGGVVRAGFEVSDERLPGLTVGGIKLAEAVTDGYYSVYESDDGYGTSLTLRATDETAAERLASQVDSGLAAASRRVKSLRGRPDLQDRARAVVVETDVAREGRTVTVSNASHGGELLAVGVAAAASFALGLGNRPTPDVPQVAFDFEYDGETLSIIHMSGDHVAASQVYLRGESLARTGGWSDLGGSASGTLDEGPAVVAGDRLTVDAHPEYRARIVWESTEGNTTATLAAHDGPEA